MKKVDNFFKRDEEISNWKKHTTPEDAEYFECQLELQQDLLKSYNSVERIIGKWYILDNAESNSSSGQSITTLYLNVLHVMT